ncbi:methyl-accepting chemotaxis protein [Pseudomonas vanderleydeniana]|uniref:Methyl-accepting chemotaxis protein n=1 Tax=Pseudomonas vanderleydeniana TaxID=2745495 RepID=A0A9E6TPB8_9PSED|nr:methyl-accepting chemotaxis protein [Pseudomonas vanderleydeniana]QXI26293.1 methyl-accepting chemotaxis protein [Pseudomonas vanderleydeniana]
MFGWIGNIRVRTKLIFGFGLVLALSSLLALGGWVAIDSLDERGIKIENIAHVAEMTKDLRVHRLQVELNPKGNGAELISQTLDKLNRHLNTARANLEDPSDLVLIDRQVAAVDVYRDALTALRNSSAESPGVFASMATQGDILLSTTQQLITSQSAKRDVDSAFAKFMLSSIAILAFILGIVAAWVITRQVVTPLQYVLLNVDRIAKGDLGVDFDVSRGDELGDLQRRLNHMIVNLRELIGGIRAGIIQLSSSAEELSAITEQTSAGVNSQKVETDHVATAMNQMAASVQDVARNAVEASMAAAEADRQALEGDNVVAEAAAQIERLAIEVNNSTVAMCNLREESEKIGGVLDVIKSVSQQTNLLALNAAIEAARAGEAGRGFAVVADEVRSLAQRTQQSTEEIQKLISSLQEGTREVSEVMDVSRALTDSSVELTRRAGKALESITQTVSTIQLMNQQIASASDQQTVVAEEINRSILNVRDISEQTASASDETAASSVDLARLGHELDRLVNRFRL